MFASIRRHQKWLWILISSLVIISFVWYFNPNVKYSRSASAFSDSSVGTIYGHPINRKDYFDAYHEAQLRYLFSYGEWPNGEEMQRMGVSIEQQTRSRLLLLEKVKQLHISVSDEAVASWIRDVFQDRDQKVFRKDAYDRFVKERLAGQGLKAADFDRYVRHEVAIQQLAQVVGVAGKLITPQEASEKYRQEHEQVDTEAAFVSSTNFLASVKIDPAALATYYTNQAAVYRVPERVQVAYVSFPASNYFNIADQKIAGETNLAARLDQIYQQRGSNYFTDANGQMMTAAAAKEKIKVEMREATALLEARKAANDFAQALMELPKGTNNLEKLAAAKGLQVKVTEPFSQYDQPAGLKVPEQFGKAAFMLTPDEPSVEQPIVGEDAVYMITLRRKLPSELPPLQAIQARVTEEYRRSQSQNLARQAGIAFHATLTNELAKGKSFKAVCDENKVHYLKLSPFSQVTPSIPELENRPAEFPQVKNAALALTTPSQTSPFMPTRDGGFVVQLKTRIPLGDAEVQKETPGYLTGLRRARQNEAFEDWFRRESELAKLTIHGEKNSER